MIAPTCRSARRIALTLGLSWVLLGALVAALRVDGANAAPATPATSGIPDAGCAALSVGDFSALLDAPTEISKTWTLGDPQQCRLRGLVSPNVGFEMALPERAAWNGKLIALGCGGFCGDLDQVYNVCTEVARRGYACVINDLGHRGTPFQGAWAYQNLAAKVDFGYRATHVSTIAAKAIVAAYYGGGAGRSYFVGCSTGGRQGLVSAQRFPDDFDGIIAGAPIRDLTNATMQIVWRGRADRDGNGRPILTAAKLPLLHRAALARCDAADGLSDGVIGDPLHCAVDPEALRCTGAEREDCLTDEQISVVRRLYAGAQDSHGRRLGPGEVFPGSELGWAGNFVATGEGPSIDYLLGAENYRYLSLLPDPGPTWKPEDFDFDRDPPRLALMEALFSGSNPDLRRFKERGGKLIMYHGWTDVVVPPGYSVDYHDLVTATMGGRARTDEFYRLFMLPGVDHCRGGAGADSVDWLTALEAWVEHGQAPDRLVGVALKSPGNFLGLDPPPAADNVRLSRPYFPFPARARYDGHGDPQSAGSFRRVEP
jgi:feruloyl esterase